MKTILIPIDFSGAAINAIEYAAELSSTLNEPTDLVLLNVYEKRQTMPAEAEEMELQYLLSKEEEAIVKLNSLVRSHGQHCGINSCKVMAASGSLSKVIVRTARQVKAHLIIMGTKGGFNQGIFHNSNNTAEMLDHAPCPVLIVPEKLPFRPLVKMVFATDFSGSNLHNLHLISKLAGSLNTQLQVVHISLPGQEKDEIERITQFWSQLQQQVKYPWLDFVNFEADEISEGLEQFAFEQHADLLVLCPKKRSLYYQLTHESTTRQLVLDALIPVLALPSTELDQMLDDEEEELADARYLDYSGFVN